MKITNERVLSLDEARDIDLGILPWRRARRIREYAKPLGGLIVDTKSLSGALDMPTRKRLVGLAAEAQITRGIEVFGREQGISDPRLAELGYCSGRLFGQVRPDGTVIEEDVSAKFISPSRIAEIILSDPNHPNIN